ncbi:hypothetical protein SAMN05660380_01832, partial [Xylella fastidiosa]
MIMINWLQKYARSAILGALRNLPRRRHLRPFALAYIVLRHRHRRMP